MRFSVAYSRPRSYPLLHCLVLPYRILPLFFSSLFYFGCAVSCQQILQTTQIFTTTRTYRKGASMTSDIKDRGELIVPGYPRLASHMALRPDTMILRRFHALNSRHLLYMQAGLCALEQRLLRVEREDAANKDGRRHLYSRDFDWLQKSSYRPEHSQMISSQQSELTSRNIARWLILTRTCTSH
jgi:hypothetical protein